MVHTAMAASIASAMVTRTLTAIEQPRASITHPPYDLNPYDVISPATAEKEKMALPVKVGDKPLKRLDSWKEVRFGFRSAGFGFQSLWTLILFQWVLISFRRILISFHASWRLERGAAWTRFGLRARGRRNPLKRLDSRKERAWIFASSRLDFPSLRLGFSFRGISDAIFKTKSAKRNHQGLPSGPCLLRYSQLVSLGLLRAPSIWFICALAALVLLEIPSTTG